MNSNKHCLAEDQSSYLTKMEAPSSSQPSQTELQTEETARLTRYLPLYKAILQGDLEVVREICTNDAEAMEARISMNFDRPLHVAVGTGGNRIVEYLLSKASLPQLALRNNEGNTILSVAAIVGNAEAAKLIVKKQRDLTNIANNCGWIPLLEATRHGQKDVVTYLLQFSEDYLVQSFQCSEDKPSVSFMNLLLIAEFYDLALELVQRHPGLGTVELYGGDSLLGTMARNPTAFPSGAQFSFWQRITHHSCETYQAALWKILLILVPNTKGVQESKAKHYWTPPLVQCLCKIITNLDHDRACMLLRGPLLLGAESGIVEVVEEILLSFPHAVWFSDEENHNIFQLAVINRQEKVFNLIFQMSKFKHLLLISEDTSGNNILHLAGKLAPQHRLSLISGAALQMQRELQWFKEVEKIVQPTYKVKKNSRRKTPAMVFTEEHKELVKEGEKWMKDTASSCTVAATLIATIVFAAAITIPGGNNSDTGHPIFLKKKAFIIFGISDTLSLFSSVAAILMFLSVLTARYAEVDFLHVLPRRLIRGLVMLLLSITSMLVAFSSTIYLVFSDEKAWILIPVGGLACVLVLLFVSSQFPLLVDMISSTYGPGIFGKKGKNMIC